MEKRTRWQDWTNAVLGAALAVSPWIMGTTSTAAILWIALLAGAAIALVAVWALERPESQAPEWIDFLLGAGLVLAPIVFGFAATTNAALFDMAVGLVVAGISVLGERSIAQSGHEHA